MLHPPHPAPTVAPLAIHVRRPPRLLSCPPAVPPLPDCIAPPTISCWSPRPDPPYPRPDRPTPYLASPPFDSPAAEVSDPHRPAPVPSNYLRQLEKGRLRELATSVAAVLVLFASDAWCSAPRHAGVVRKSFFFLFSGFCLCSSARSREQCTARPDVVHPWPPRAVSVTSAGTPSGWRVELPTLHCGTVLQSQGPSSSDPSSFLAFHCG